MAGCRVPVTMPALEINNVAICPEGAKIIIIIIIIKTDHHIRR